MKARLIEFTELMRFPRQTGTGQLPQETHVQRLENVEFDNVMGPGIALLFEDDGKVQQHVIPLTSVRRIVLEDEAIGAFDSRTAKNDKPRITLAEGAERLAKVNAEFDAPKTPHGLTMEDDAAETGTVGTGAAGERAEKPNASGDVRSR